VGTIAGCRVQDGVIRRDAEVKVMRGDEQVFKGKINSLKRFKDDAREVTNGMECGIGLAGFSDLKEGDIIEAFSTEKGAGRRPGRSDYGQGITVRKLAGINPGKFGNLMNPNPGRF
jgi:translation elongation factor EF-1alpha